jgi:osomolarity two-component system sensor histidine kinase NIK1
MVLNLTNHIRFISVITKAVDVNVQGRMPELKNTVNSMVHQLSTLAREVTCVSLEVGTEGRLDGQAQVDGVQAEWSKLADHVNVMADNWTYQVRSIATVTRQSRVEI